MERYKGYLDGEGGEAECVVEASPVGVGTSMRLRHQICRRGLMS